MARTVMDAGHVTPAEAVAGLNLIPEDLRARVQRELEAEQIIRVQDFHMIEDRGRRHRDWLRSVDRQAWYYWPTLRLYLIDRLGWSPRIEVQPVEDATDRILAAVEDPRGDEAFDVRGLVVGFVQSGKTVNYTGLIAKAADTGYRLVIVLSGIHDSLRQQTQRRLNAELVGDQAKGVGRPPDDLSWFTYTTTDLHGDFDPGSASPAPLSSGHPVLIVVKKRVPVLERLTTWLDGIPEGTRNRLPVLVIDDEADLASINTRGNRRGLGDEDEERDEAIEDSPPSRTNELIRLLLRGFRKVAYVQYTATPFANVLIDHEAEDRVAGEDLYPRSFILALPPPPGYYGAEKIFGPSDEATAPGMDVIRRVPDEDLEVLVPGPGEDANRFEPILPASLVQAIDDFVLAGSARYERGNGDDPATMLIHTSYLRTLHQRLYELVRDHVAHIRNEWRYRRSAGIEDRLRNRWETEFRRVTRAEDVSLDVAFDRIRPHINDFLEHPVEVLQINSNSLDELDYQRDPSLKAVVVGGNRLSRGLTLEGLLVSYYVRRARNYDTLLQMERWFGFRDGYADLTRLYTTEQLEQWFRDLVTVDAEVREDIRRYEQEDLTPLDVGVRIRRHPALLVTDRLKMRSAHLIESPQFVGQLVQTINFPFDNIDWLRTNLETTRRFLASLGVPNEGSGAGKPMWRGVPWEPILHFLETYQMDPSALRVRSDLLRKFIREEAREGHLIEWVVGVLGQARRTDDLGDIDLDIAATPRINSIARTRLARANSLKAITSQEDQALGLTDDEIARARAIRAAPGPAYRQVRGETKEGREGVLMIYPISRFSGYLDGRPDPSLPRGRVPIFQEPSNAEDIIGVALVFPSYRTAAPPAEYFVGTVGAGSD